jgi:esterase/lipase superfamily enzyme
MIVLVHLCYSVHFTGLILQNHLIPAVDFMFRHPDCFSDVVILSSVRLASSFNVTIACSSFQSVPVKNVKQNPLDQICKC